MGIAKELRNLSKEYLRNPKGQYYRHLKQILDLHKSSGVTVNEVLKYVKEWGNSKRNKT